MIIEFEGQQHEFPDDFTDEEVSAALEDFTSDNAAAVSLPTFDDSGSDTGYQGTVTIPVDDLETDGLVSLSAAEQKFADDIAEIETGNLQNRFIRTQVKGSASSAYGTYQITRGLLRGTLQNNPDVFTEAEQRAAQALIERQSVALAVGGSDRAAYEPGGRKHAMALRWAQQYGYDNVKTFLDDFDYGGTLGLSNNGQFQVMYENIGRKLLQQHLKDADGNGQQAAAVWHGGPKWKNSTHKGTTQQYINKYNRLQTQAPATPQAPQSTTGFTVKPTVKQSFVNADARYGELGQLVQADGTISTEVSITENVPELGGWVNLPTLVTGQKDVASLIAGKQPTQEQINIAVARAIERVQNGAQLPSYPSVENAVKAAQDRTESVKMLPYK